MKIETKRFGTIDVPEDRIIHIPYGLPGFEDIKRYVIIDDKKFSPFCFLQSIDEPLLGFIIINPFLILKDYKIKLNGTFQKMSWRNEPADLSYFVVVTIPKNAPDKMTANLMGPVVINNKTREGIQLVLQDNVYSCKYPLLS